MTVSSVSNRNDYIGNGNVDTYSFTFKIFDSETDTLLVTVRDPDTGDETTLTLDTHYTVTGDGEPNGGSISLVNGAFDWLDAGGDLEVDWALSIRRVLPLVQETDIRNQGAYYPEIHEEQFDRIVMIEQQQDDEIGRSLKLPETIAGSTFDTELPGLISDAASAGCALIVNDTVDGFDIGPNAADIATAQSNAAAALASQVAAAASAAAAAASALSAQNLFRDVTVVATGTYTVTSADRAKVLLFTNNCTVTLPQISTLDLTSAYAVALMAHPSGTITLTIQRGSTDTIQDGTTTVTSVTYYNAQEGGIFVPDTDLAPDQWTVIPVIPRRTTYNQINLLASSAVTSVPTSEKLAITNTSALSAEAIEAVSLRKRNVVTKTSTFTATIYEEEILVSASGGAVTANLYTAVGNTGRVIRLRKTDTTSNAVTIDPNSTETIGGTTTLPLNANGDTVLIVSDGANWQVLQRSITPTIQVFAASGTWTRPNGCRSVYARGVGGGGGGGGAPTTTAGQISCGSGGGYGGYSERWIANPAATETVTIGAAGTTGAGANGGNGGTTSFGTWLQATGGTGGSTGSAVAGVRAVTGAGGGVGSVGDVNGDGPRGSSAWGAASLPLVMAGDGAGGMFGKGGSGSIVTTGASAGGAATGYGAGGGGGGNGTTGASGVAGGAATGGLVIVVEFY